MTARLTIGEVAREAGVAATALRYYEQIGLVPPVARLGGQRRYDESILARLEVIRLCKSAGFALDEIQRLFADDAPGRPASRALA
ncbi:MerR family transcriptional regulator, partial [Mycobacterium sp.]|uniref:MerR family transcriptional regulator n=1 Tax=Mycobacterium sp. TaxID=1785 RepID=UPI003C7347F8